MIDIWGERGWDFIYFIGCEPEEEIHRCVQCSEKTRDELSLRRLSCLPVFTLCPVSSACYLPPFVLIVSPPAHPCYHQSWVPHFLSPFPVSDWVWFVALYVSLDSFLFMLYIIIYFRFCVPLSSPPHIFDSVSYLSAGQSSRSYCLWFGNKPIALKTFQVLASLFMIRMCIVHH